MHNGHYHEEEYKDKLRKAADIRFGSKEDHIKICELCNQEYIWFGRKSGKDFEKSRFCSISCARSFSGSKKWNGHVYSENDYRDICFRHHEHECVICSHDKIIDVHHYDQNRLNNLPENLVPLCAICHRMIHRKQFVDEVKPIVDKYVDNFIKNQYHKE